MTDVIASPHFLNTFNTTKTSSIVGAINSTFSGGAAFGALFGGVIMDKYGRRKTIGIGAFICTIGAILQAASYQYVNFLVGTWSSGFGLADNLEQMLTMPLQSFHDAYRSHYCWFCCGPSLHEWYVLDFLVFPGQVHTLTSFRIVPVYQSECASPQNRGLIVGLAQQMIGVGFIVSTWVGYGSHHMPDTSSFQWRFPLAFQAFPSVLLCIGMFWLPETPRHLIAIDKLEEAEKILHKLHFDGTNEEWIKQEFKEIKMTINAEKAATAPGWLIMFKVPQWRKRLALGTLVQVFTQFTGINVIGYYQTVMYEALGFTGKTNLLVAGIYNCCGPVASKLPTQSSSRAFFFSFFMLYYIHFIWICCCMHSQKGNTWAIPRPPTTPSSMQPLSNSCPLK